MSKVAKSNKMAIGFGKMEGSEIFQGRRKPDRIGIKVERGGKIEK